VLITRLAVHTHTLKCESSASEGRTKLEKGSKHDDDLSRRTSIIMASGRELSYVLLGGILSSYACAFVILAHPGTTICVSK